MITEEELLYIEGQCSPSSTDMASYYIKQLIHEIRRLRTITPAMVERGAVGIHKWASKGTIAWETEDQAFYRMAATACLKAALEGK